MQKFISREKFEKLVEKLQFLKNIKRPQVAEKIASAKDLGDLSENAEYSEAKDDQVLLEREIAELEHMIQIVVIVEKSKNQNNISFGSIVEIKYNGQYKKYSIVGSAEADPSQNKISNESPLGSALMGHAVGDSIEVKTPKGLVEYTVLKIS
ncbi:transcription elongation factor GreA [Candidatus Kuenenbacteria bacterium HGW-Kuenenbacteria-1]|uniref:Transcription elongation factor GreA n=1 Tax=Candidatus Kuenenbacteria bacterium HGW-Kuenenbacteria-1 TaxID=2013812 RepID=A0A2N1UN46_9BACT|nr:MAG: transcription elongation factor GreA [Candidatus Kuenenbacteria bacterium HGW-Kuenenbacteria-1]